jgi:putative ABC transport system substrate-binding protein
MLKDVAPDVTRVAVMFNRRTAPRSGNYFLEGIEAAANQVGVTTIATPVGDPAQIENAFASFAGEPGSAVIVIPDIFTTIHRRLVIAEAAKYRIPAVYPFRYFATDGGLMSYGADLIELYRRAPAYVDRILKGSQPAELPVQGPPKFELVVNLDTAKRLGLTVPRLLLARADEVIE